MSFGDIRISERADWLIERVATAGTLVLRKLGETRAGEKAVHRFLSSRYVSVDRIVETLAARTAAQCVGRRILAIQDTSEIGPRQEAARLWTRRGRDHTRLLHPSGDCPRYRERGCCGPGRRGDLDADRGTGCVSP